VGRRRPADRDAVAAHHHEQPLADRRPAVVAGTQHAPLDLVAEARDDARNREVLAQHGADLGQVRVVRRQAGGQRRHEGLEGAPLVRLDRAAVRVQRSPALELLDVLEEHQPRRQLHAPLEHHPRQPSRLLVQDVEALGLGEVGAGRREPHGADRPVAGHQRRVDQEHVLAVVARGRVVGVVHAQRLAVVVDGDVGIAPERFADGLAGAAAAGEVIGQDLVAEVQLQGEVVALHAGILCCADACSSPFAASIKSICLPSLGSLR
jgi:hypothetical protein